MGEGNDCDRKLSFCYGSCLVTVVSSLLPVSPCSPVILSHHVPRALRYAPVSSLTPSRSGPHHSLRSGSVPSRRGRDER